MTEKEKMLKGMIYDPSEAELSKLRTYAHNLSLEYNMLKDDEGDKKAQILKKLLGSMGENVYIQGPMQFDYGCNTYLGNNVYVNFNFTVLDVCEVKIGSNVLIGPNVSILTPLHPLDKNERRIRDRGDGNWYDYEYGSPITIKDNCWIASNVIILPGVTIGEGCVIGAGSVVSKSIPDGYLAYGNPCRPIRKLTEKDKIMNESDEF